MEEPKTLLTEFGIHHRSDSKVKPLKLEISVISLPNVSKLTV